MKKYSDYTLRDFVEDDNFCHWVLNPDANTILFWDLWLRDHPTKRKLVLEAREIVSKLNGAASELITPEIVNSTWSAIEDQIDLEPNQQSKPSVNSQIFKIAAVVTVFICCLFFIGSDVLFQNHQNSEVVSDSHPSKWIENKNESDAIQRIELKDGSTVTLEPNSTLRYPSLFSENRRNVILNGDAFFEIAHDSTKAFYVYANDAVIRVLGTSFHVKAAEDDNKVEVIVKTGKVAVYKRNELKELARIKSKKVYPVFVTPNQKVVMDRANLKMVKRLTSAPIQIAPLALLPSLRFEDAYVTDILAALKKAYGIEILPARNSDLSCKLTTTLTEKSLYENLDIICYPLGLNYYEKNGQLMINGKCK